MTQKEWLEYFELLNNRKPTAQEFAAAKRVNFDVTAETTEIKEEVKTPIPPVASVKPVQEMRPAAASYLQSDAVKNIQTTAKNSYDQVKKTVMLNTRNKVVGGIALAVIAILLIFAGLSAIPTQNSPSGTYHLDGAMGNIGLLYFTDNSDTLTFNNGQVTYTGAGSGAIAGTGTTTAEGTYTIANGQMNISIPMINYNATFPYSANLLGNFTITSSNGDTFTFAH